MPEEPNSQENKIQRLRGELEKSIVISDAQKKFWSETGPAMSPVALDCLLNDIVEANRYVNECINAALKNDPESTYSSMLKNQEKKIRSEAYRIEEQAEKPDAEAILNNL